MESRAPILDWFYAHAASYVTSHVKMAKLVVGVDVGGTNTDAVILRGNEVIASVKYPTTPDRTTGVRTAIENVIENLVQSPSHSEYTSRVDVIKFIKRVNIGTTHFVNALIERKNLQKVGVIRLCGSSTRALPPFTDFPEDLRKELDGGHALVQGGYECTRKEIAGIDQDEIIQNVQQLWSNGVHNIVISGVFSPLIHDHEVQVSEMIRKALPDVSMTLSHSVSCTVENIPYCEKVWWVENLVNLTNCLRFTKLKHIQQEILMKGKFDKFTISSIDKLNVDECLDSSKSYTCSGKRLTN